MLTNTVPTGNLRLEIGSISIFVPIGNYRCHYEEISNCLLGIMDPSRSPNGSGKLTRRMMRKGNRAGTEVLVQWAGALEEDATWEDMESLKERFPDLVGKVL